MRKIIIILIKISLLLTACRAPSPDIQTTVQYAIAATQHAIQAETQASQVTPTPSPQLTPTTTLTQIYTEMPQSIETLPGNILIITETDPDNEGTSRDLILVTDGETITIASNLYEEIDLSSDITKIANYGHHDNELRVITLGSNITDVDVTEYKIPEIYDGYTQRYIRKVIWSPDSSKLAIITDCNLYVLLLDTGEFVLVSDECYQQVMNIAKGPKNVAWSPDGFQIAFDLLNRSNLPVFAKHLHGDRPGRLIVANSDGTLLKELDETGSAPVWSPDGQRILYRGGFREDSPHHYCNEKVYVINTDGTDRLQMDETLGDSDDYYSLDYYKNLGWSSDVDWVFFRNKFADLKSSRADGSETIVLSNDVYTYTYLPQSNRIVWKYEDDLFVSNLDGTNRSILVEDVGAVNSISSSPCGDRVIWSKSSRWYAVDLDGGDTIRIPSEPIFSTDCTRMLYIDEMKVYVSEEIGTWSVVIDELPGDSAHILAWIR